MVVTTTVTAVAIAMTVLLVAGSIGPGVWHGMRRPQISRVPP